MANSFTIEIKGLDKLSGIYRQLPINVRKNINQEFRATGEQWRGEAIQDAPVNNGRLRSSINLKNGDLNVELAARVGYAAYQEFGTKSKVSVPPELRAYAAQFQGGGGTQTGNPIQALQLWVKRKGLAANYTVKGKKVKQSTAIKSLAFLIFRKIKKEGVAPRPFLFSPKSAPGSGDRYVKFVKLIKERAAKALQDAL